MTNTQYLAWLNQELRADRDYVEGMAFFHTPEGVPSESAAGHSWVPVEGKDAVYVRISSRVLRESIKDEGR